MKLDFDKMWDSITLLGGMSIGAAVVFFLVTGLNTCQRQSNEATLNETNARNKALQECIDKNQDAWKCKETIR